MARDARLQLAVDAHFAGLGLALQQALGGQHMLHFAGADAKGQRAKSAVGGGVAVAADDGHPGLGQAQLGADDMHDALVGAVQAIQADAELAAVVFQLCDLACGSVHPRRPCGLRR